MRFQPRPEKERKCLFPFTNTLILPGTVFFDIELHDLFMYFGD